MRELRRGRGGADGRGAVAALAAVVALLVLAILQFAREPDEARATSPAPVAREVAPEADALAVAPPAPSANTTRAVALRLVDAETAEPVAAGTVSHRWILAAGQTARAKVAFADGALTLNPPAGASKLWLDATAEGASTTTAQVDLALDEVHEVRIHRLAALRIAVHDERDDRPIENLLVRVARVRQSTDGVVQREIEATTGKDGTVSCEVAVGTYAVTCEGNELEAASQTIAVRSTAANVVTFRIVAFRPELRGTVLESSTSRPLAGATVELGTSAATTDAEGRFSISTKEQHAASSMHGLNLGTLRARPPAARPDLHAETVSVSWHTADLTIALRPSRMELLVVDAAGKPDERWSVSCHTTHRVPTDAPKWEPAKRISAGRYEFPEYVTPTRSCVLRVERAGEATRFASMRMLEPHDEAHCRLLVWRIPEPSEVAVVVASRTDASPVVGAKVELLFHALGEKAAVATSRPVANYDLVTTSPFADNTSQLLGEGTTDETGTAHVRASLHGACYVRATHADFETAVVALDAGTSTVRLVMRPRAKGCLLGTVAGDVSGTISFQPVLAESMPDRTRRTRSARLVNGAFTITDCDLGLYTAVMTEARGPGADRQFSFRRLGLVEALSCPGKQVTLQATDEANCLVELSGESLRVGDELFVVSQDRLVHAQSRVAPDGIARLRLLPGHYVVTRIRRTLGQWLPVDATEPLRVRAADAVVRFAPQFPVQRGRVRLLRNGEPVRRQPLGLEERGLPAALYVTDADGWVDFRAVPSTNFVLVPRTSSDTARDPCEGLCWRIDGPCAGQSLEAEER